MNYPKYSMTVLLRKFLYHLCHGKMDLETKFRKLALTPYFLNNSLNSKKELYFPPIASKNNFHQTKRFLSHGTALPVFSPILKGS